MPPPPTILFQTKICGITRASDAVAADQAMVRTFMAVCTMAGCAMYGVEAGTGRYVDGARRQFAPVRRDGDIPGANLIRRWRPSESVGRRGVG